MKKYISLLFCCALSGGIILLSSCGGSKSEQETTVASDDPAGIAASDDKPDTLKHRIIEILKTDPIPIEAAVWMMEKLLKEPKLQMINNETIGGYFSASEFVIKSGKTGVLLWYCFNETSTAYPKFFLALEQVDGYDKKNPKYTPGKDVTVPFVFKYTASTDYSQSDVTKFIVEHKTLLKWSPKNIPGDSVEKYSQNFLAKMKELSPTKPYLGYRFAYFEKNDAYDAFMKKDPVHVRYYFGLADDPDHKPNYFRMILAGVNKDGGTITTKDDDDPLLQKSWPPPPDAKKADN